MLTMSESQRGPGVSQCNQAALTTRHFSHLQQCHEWDMQ